MLDDAPLRPEDIAPLRAPSRQVARQLAREAPVPGWTSGRSTRRLFLQRAGLAALAVGAASFTVVGRGIRPAAAGNYDIHGNGDCTEGSSTSFYVNNGTVPCGPSWVCNSSPWVGGCRDLNGYHRHYMQSDGDGWKLRPSYCPPGTNWDGWKWNQASWGGCTTAHVRCHDGYKMAAWNPTNTNVAHRMACV